MKKKLHSEEYFSEPRDFWWNNDFLELMAKRWNLDRVRTVLDAGSGLGHWGQTLAPYLNVDCKVIGVDRESEWARRATERARARGLQGNFLYQQGDVTALDFPDNSFDLVTCQTLLIHVRDPELVIREFIRVLKPGGLLAAVEPNNMAATLVMNSLSFYDPIEKVLDSVKFHLISQRGKASLGEGHNSTGDLIPGYFAKAGLQNIQTYLSDKACQMFAPYDSPEQRAVINQIEDWEERDICYGDKDESKHYFVAGGGNVEEFDRLWNITMNSERAESRAARSNGTYHTAGGCLSYLVSGVKT